MYYIYIIYINLNIYIYIHSSVLPLRSVGRSNFDKGLHNFTTLIQKQHILMRTAVLYIYMYIMMYIRCLNT